MEGFQVPYIPGWDCHGLPIEHQVSKQLGSKKKDLSADRTDEKSVESMHRNLLGFSGMNFSD